MLNSNDRRKQNIAKYGNRNDDVIARSYREGVDIGNVWCLKNVEKYLRRFLSHSAKGNNLIDLLKAKDYLDRAVEINQKLAKKDSEINKQEIIEKLG